ncbi:MAG TPA: cell division protein FtsK, partial [Oceanospirillales bacterium]|nr:cell division protein FtsK [Oceanospirillales bacterium]
LDQGGAEQLLGHGDMLFMPPGNALPERVHGAFVDDDEVHRVVAEWKQRGEPDYIEEITQVGEDGMLPGAGGAGEEGGEQDDLFDLAVAFVTESGKCSISSVQRKLRIGYNRAARLVESMEAAGVVSPPAHNGSREVLAGPPPGIN